MLTQLKILQRLIRARRRIGFRSGTERVAFYTQINPVFNLLFNAWFSSLRGPSSAAAGFARRLVSWGIGFGALRHMSPESRNRFARLVLRESPQGAATRQAGAEAVLAALADRGYAKLPFTLTGSVVEKAKQFFANREHFAAQVYAQSDRIPLRRDWRTYGDHSPHRYICFRREDTIEFLASIELGDGAGLNLAFLKDLADAYCGFDTSLYGANTFGTLPGAGAGYAMRVHRDYDDFNFLTIFIAWTGTSGDDGATLYAPSSHRRSDVAGDLIPLAAQPGDIYVVDTFGLHAGNSRVLQARLATWLRFGHRINLATIQDGC